MAQTKLILVESIPGSGKTTTAVFVAEWLQRQGVETAVFLEGNLDHPADFESIACLDASEYAVLKAQFPEYTDFLSRRFPLVGCLKDFSFICPLKPSRRFSTR